MATSFLKGTLTPASQTQDTIFFNLVPLDPILITLRYEMKDPEKNTHYFEKYPSFNLPNSFMNDYMEFALLCYVLCC